MNNQDYIHYKVVVDSFLRVSYYAQHDIKWFSVRYNKGKTFKAGDCSDGATYAITRPESKSHWIHDAICNKPRWDDGSKITALQAAITIHDILRDEANIKLHKHRPISATLSKITSVYWAVFTFLFGCTKARLNGWW